MPNEVRQRRIEKSGDGRVGYALVLVSARCGPCWLNVLIISRKKQNTR